MLENREAGMSVRCRQGAVGKYLESRWWKNSSPGFQSLVGSAWLHGRFSGDVTDQHWPRSTWTQVGNPQIRQMSAWRKLSNVNMSTNRKEERCSSVFWWWLYGTTCSTLPISDKPLWLAQLIWAWCKQFLVMQAALVPQLEKDVVFFFLCFTERLRDY